MNTSSIRRYDAYKDSGIEWMGEVPAHWEVKRIKEICELNKSTLSEKTPANYEFEYVDIGSVTYGIKGYVKERITFDTAPSRAKRIVTKGDTIISTVRTYLKAIASIDEDVSDLIVSTGFAVISPRKQIVHKYCSYLLTSEFIIDEICALSTGVNYPATNATVIGNLFFLIPPLTEQTVIVAYLDTKTAQIDQKIDLLSQKATQYAKLKQSLINETVTRGLDKTVPMKDSGVEWIGEVPVHWGVFPLKDLASKSAGSFVDGPFGSDLKSDEYTDTGVPLIQLNNIGIGVHFTKNRKFISEAKALSLSKHRAYPGEIAIAKMAEPVARATVISKEFPMYVIVADCIKFKPDSRISQAKFLSYALNTTGVKSQAEILSNGTTRIRINLGTTKILKVVTPPLPEQKAIAEYLDEKTAHIDCIVATINTQISKLKELRKTLINDVVTGKIKVVTEGQTA